jgi:hypothetical protein
MRLKCFLLNIQIYINLKCKTNSLKVSVEDDQKVIQKLDTKKEVFSVQEVIELTILHAQQVHVLQKFYE